MQKLFLSFLATTFGANLALAHHNDRHISGPISATLTHIIDGDTIGVVLTPWLYTNVRTNVRIAGIDTPEIRRPKCEEERAKGHLAVEHITQLLGAVDDNAPAIVLTDIIPDKFGGRVVAQVQTANGVNLGQSLLNAGLAQPYDGGTKPLWCA